MTYAETARRLRVLLAEAESITADLLEHEDRTIQRAATEIYQDLEAARHVAINGLPWHHPATETEQP